MSDVKYKHERVECGVCKKVFPAFWGDIKRNKAKFCSRECAKISQTESKVESTCTACGIKFFRKKYKLHKGKIYCSHKCFLKNASAFIFMKRENHPRWKGGFSRPTKITAAHVRWRRKIFKRDNYTCVYCGKKGGLQADHLWPVSVAPHLRYKLKNGQTLCVECHRKTITYGTKILDVLRCLDSKKITIDNIDFSPERILQVKRQVQKDFPELCK